ncbi:asparagine synthase [Candidatus Scalindua japonica]|uniref:asparagine synthase (glutamine-hydrolyzing) n=1 Tax=Candidatus Scalindua japonica TaxID=1284222 RepID=A0A286TZB5_9BACT|nr:asparagine synthase (glutamine-hydrolyzing) [Candidatus Scalindua japonica]GAX61232.1 asparagine synthase [Candidatus Scalindua japonica]
MCGICGKVNFDKDSTVDRRVLENMMAIMNHRGPDDKGMYIKGQVGLGHKRLSIIDLNTGKQPISNEDMNVWVVYNGEIYNYRELRKRLIEKGHVFKTESDTEVIVHLYEEYGESFISELRGMFAFALWDEKESVLLLARDRVGIKPLYYCMTKDSFLFSSEMKSILEDPKVKREENPEIVDRFLTYFYIPGTETLLKGIHKLSPGHYLILKNEKINIKQYWDLNFSNSKRNYSFEDSKGQLIDLLRESVRDHMISDVPVGFLLSGGIDSTALLSFAIDETDKDISTFTIGFEGESFADERPFARLAAEKFGTKHYEMTMSSQGFLNFLPKYVWHMEEPVCEPPAIALYYVSKLAKEHVKVLISGEGGDEAFAGYPNYRNYVWMERIKKIIGPLNSPISVLIDKLGNMRYLEKLKKYAPLMTLEMKEYYYSRTSSPSGYFNDNKNEFYSKEFGDNINKNNSAGITRDYFENITKVSNLNKMLYIDTKTWLPDDLLTKADKITMANSVELRVPLLDHRLLEFAANLPDSHKLNWFTTKHILKKAFSNKVPKEILYRKKTGFPVPYESWLRNEMKDFVYDIMMDKKTLNRGYFEKKSIERLIRENSQRMNHSKVIFSLIVLELWHRKFIDNDCIT